MTGDPAAAARPAADPPVSPPELVARLRELHVRMVEAVLGGEGLRRVAEITAQAAGAPVAIVVPRLGAAELAPDADAVLLTAAVEFVDELLAQRPAAVPEAVAAYAPIRSGDEVVGAVLLLGDGTDVAPESPEFLHLASVACLTEVAVEEARQEVEQNLRGAFLEDLRARPDLERQEIVRRAARLGCDVAGGAVVLCAELDTSRPRHVVATISGDHPGALAQHVTGVAGAPERVYALLPSLDTGDDAPERTLHRARTLAERLGRYGTVGLSAFCQDPAGLAQAMQEAELVLDVLRHSDASAERVSADAGSGTYRLLFRVLASRPEEVRSFYEDTVAPIVRYDEQYRSDLLHTLDAYLDHNCNMNATAAAIYAHRHTVAYRLDRIRELTGLDPTHSEDRERLGLGLKAHRIIAPRLPR
jgi:sugar diacid utilization regulator